MRTKRFFVTPSEMLLKQNMDLFFHWLTENLLVFLCNRNLSKANSDGSSCFSGKIYCISFYLVTQNIECTWTIQEVHTPRENPQFQQKTWLPQVARGYLMLERAQSNY